MPLVRNFSINAMAYNVNVRTFVKGKRVKLFSIAAKPSDTVAFVKSKINEMLGNTNRRVWVLVGRARSIKTLTSGELGKQRIPIFARVEPEAEFLERKQLKVEKEQCCEKLNALLTGWIPSRPHPSPNNAPPILDPGPTLSPPAHLHINPTP